MSETEAKDYYKLDDTINRLIVPIYQMTEHSKEWIKDFWLLLTSYYKDNDRDKRRIAKGVIEDALTSKHISLAKHLPLELCALAEMFWTYSPEEDYGLNFHHRDRDDIAFQYGLSEKAEQYEQGSSRNSATDSNFFLALFNKNFWIGLDWAIDFVNKSVLSFAEKHEGGLPTYEINFIEDGI